MKDNIMLIGFMGTGKSTVSKKLAALTGYSEIDLDEYIVRCENKTINEIFADSGEDVFRSLETMYLGKVLEENETIISCGGGTVIRDANVDIMKANGTIVLLTATPQTIYDRVKDTNNRPILNGNMNVAYIEELLKKRENYYLRAADVVIATDNKSVDEICREILEKIKKNS